MSLASAEAGTVYAIRHPRTRAVVYVGSTTKALSARLDSHISAARCKYGRHSLKGWIRSLDEKPLIEPLVSGVPADMIRRLETVAIAAMLGSGVKLLNDKPPVSLNVWVYLGISAADIAAADEHFSRRAAGQRGISQ